MRGKKILAFICGLIMVCHQITVSLVPAYAEEAETRTVTLNDDFVSSLLVEDKMYDETTKADGRTDTTVQISDFELTVKSKDASTATGNSNYILSAEENDIPIPSVPSTAEIFDISIEKQDATTLQQYDFGIVANGSVKITMNAEVKDNSPVTFTLSDGQTFTDDAPAYNLIENNYIAQAKFVIGLNENMTSNDTELSCTIDCGNQTDKVGLQMRVDDSHSTTSRVIIDKKKPVVSDIALKNHGKEDERYFDVKGAFTDYESGIKKIRYRWDNDVKATDWIEYDGFSHYPGVQVEFSSAVNWDNSVDSRSKRPDGSHKLELEITDNAGNVYTDDGSLVTDGADTQSPCVTYIRLDKTTETSWDKIVNVLSFGTYVNQKLVLSLKVEDRSESEQPSGVKSVMLMDVIDSNETIIAELNASSGLYAYTIEADRNISSWYVKLTDQNGNYAYYSIRTLLQSDTLEDNKIGATAVTDMDWSKLESDTWVFDFSKPVIEFDLGNVITEDKTPYYNNKGGKLIISISDEGGLKSVAIKETYKALEANETTEKIVKNDSYTEGTKSCTHEVNTAELKTGWYTYCVTASDFAGNPESVKQVQFYVDHISPEGSISVISPLSSNIVEDNNTSEYWIREKAEDGNYLSITFRLDATSKGAKLHNISIDVIGRNSHTKHFDFSDNQIKSEDGTYFVTATISTDPNSTDFLECNDNNIYEVRASIETASHNISQEIYYELHVDTDNPIVEKFNVERKNTAAETILNVLTFGVFANDSIRLTVNAKDGDHDIGLDHVEISYKDSNGSDITSNMIEQGNGVYYYDLNIDTKIFQSDITVTAFDKFNKSSKNIPNIQNTLGDKSTLGNTFVMLETNAPSLVVKLSSTDSSARDDGQIWYRKHDGGKNDSEKYIELIVQDKDSGIRQVNMTINGQSIEQFSNDLERNKNALPNIGSTEAVARDDRTKLCDELHFFFSIDSIALKIPAKDDGSYEIEVEVIDNAGNVTKTPVDENNNPYAGSKVVYYRDVVSPNVVQFIFDPASFDDISQVNQEEFIQELEYGYFFKSEFDVMIISEDPGPSSKLDYAVFRLIPYENGKKKEEIVTESIPIVDGVAKYTIPAGFKGQIYGKIFDKVNNVSEECTPRGFVVDKTTPVIIIEPLPENAAGKDANGNNIYTEIIRFRVTVSDTQSGIRSISYSKSSELDSYEDIITDIDNEAGTNEDKNLANGWQIIHTDANLVTEASKVFTFDKDDNDISMTFNATDRAGNVCESIESSKFTIDTTIPKITVSNTSALLNDLYYNGSTEFTINVVERNFSPEMITCKIENFFTAASPIVSFYSDENDKSVHTAKILFPEGDYSLSLSGIDLCGHRAVITYNGESASEHFFTSFNVDATKPTIKTNFNDFGKDGDEGIYFNKGQTAEIIVTEHNFYDDDMGISVMFKAPGSAHVINEDGWTDIAYKANWKDEGDKHTLEIFFTEDGIYRISMVPKDRAGNQGEFLTDSPDHTAIFEIDTTAPVYSARNGESATEKGFVKTPFCDVYDEKRGNEKPPTVEFDDVNFDRIEVDTIIYTPTYENGKELGEIIISPISVELSKPVNDKKFTLSNFSRDGVYALTFVAVDKAGNKSEPINNTYFRMVDTDVLAYIYNSRIGDKNSNDENKRPSGYYSLMSVDGKAISKKATDFDDLDVLVIKPVADKQAGTLVLREDEKQYSPYNYSAFTIENEEISETAMLMKMHLPSEYFSETFRDDGLNARMYLSVSIRDDVYLDLASIHIDNEAPTAALPHDFENWHNYFFKSEQTITLTDISEVLNDELSKVYECQGNGQRVEIPHTYDPKTNTLSFTLNKGVHHIDITLADEAGNEWNIDRVKYVRVGNFRLYLGGIIVLVGASLTFLLIRKKKKRATQK
ncbi:MAG: hypothetical protein HDT42_03050 [Ruminococcaceae bacterium]|nr:hypothetical protein [Oscillospiraceae bacterium]